MRLQKYLADCGVASRRKAEELIISGRVTVNGATAKIGDRAEVGELVRVNGAPIYPQDRRAYIMLNKPCGVISACKDQFGRPCVLNFVEDGGLRLFPVGRLDYDTSGLIFITNDGEFAYKLTHPRHNIEKTYLARVKGTTTDDDVVRLTNGVLVDGRLSAPAKVRLVERGLHSSTLEITITEGRNRQVRKMFEAVNRIVTALKRLSVGGVELGGLKEGSWRKLTEDEINSLTLI